VVDRADRVRPPQLAAKLPFSTSGNEPSERDRLHPTGSVRSAEIANCPNFPLRVSKKKSPAGTRGAVQYKEVPSPIGRGTNVLHRGVNRTHRWFDHGNGCCYNRKFARVVRITDFAHTREPGKMPDPDGPSSKKPGSWAVTLIKNRGVFLGFVAAPEKRPNSRRRKPSCSACYTYIGRRHPTSLWCRWPAPAR
jgi:hypothetical protein